MKFIDKTEIKAIAGSGGDGMACFKRAKGKPNLGPDGGNGGNGADVVLIGDHNKNTLSSIRFREIFKAESGERGGSSNKTGKCGNPIHLKLPFGTIIFDVHTGEKLGELLPEAETFVVARGGKRGYGNRHFTTSVRQAPSSATKGEKGEEKDIRLELKLLADIGLAGFPNAGKSTLLSKISAARPKIADYPFTTLVPNLGVVDVEEESFVVTDIPGLIEGAHLGKGLGHEFLKHLERTKIIAFIIDGSEGAEPALSMLYKLRQELELYSESLASKPRILVLNKIDMLPPPDLELMMDRFKQVGEEPFPISALTGKNIQGLKYFFANALQKENTKAMENKNA